MTKILDLSSIPEEIKEAWCCFEAFRRYGVPSDDIWIYPDEIDKTIKMAIGSKQDIALRKVEGAERVYDFVATVGQMTLSSEETISVWTNFTEAINNHEISNQYLSELWKSSGVRVGLVSLIIAMKAKGIDYGKNYDPSQDN